MAINNLLSRQQWVELASASPTSGTTVTFSSLNEYSNYKIAYFDVDLSSLESLFLTINNDTGSNYAYIRQIDDGSIDGSGVTNSINLGQASNGSGIIIINDANNVIKQISWFHARANDSLNGQGFWNSQNVINRFDISVTGVTFSSGTIKVYGRN